jgi:glycosyltransferase involved in cell wall biosynthesis
MPLAALRPRVLVANNYAHVRGGSDRCFLAHVRLLAERGHAVSTLATRPPAGAAPEGLELIEPIELARPGPRDLLRFHYSLAARRAVTRLLAGAARPEVAHLHITYGQLTASILGPLRRAGIPVVQTLHEYRLACPVGTFVSNGALCEACSGGRTWRALARRCNRGSLPRTLASVSEHAFSRTLGAETGVALFLAPSEFLRQKMLAHGLPPARIRVLANFVDPRAHAPGHGPGEHALFLGRLERLKGVLTLVRAAAEVPELPLLVAGEGEARAELEALVRAPGLGHVRLLGQVESATLVELVRRARCVVVPSEWYENLPMSVLEAMAHARAVIATRIGGIPELVREGETGFLVPPGDSAALSERLRFAARNGDELAALGRAGRARVEAEFGPERHYEELLSAYRSVGA